MKNNRTLEKEKMYYSEHLPEWMIYYPGKYVLIKETQFCGIFGTVKEALAEGVRLFGKDSFLVRKIEKSESAFIPSLPLGIFHTDRLCPV
jgi:hypothetical protein